jgi:hypothetical protein
MLPPHPRTMPHADPSIELSLLPFGQEALTMFRFVSWRSGGASGAAPRRGAGHRHAGAGVARQEPCDLRFPVTVAQ